MTKLYPLKFHPVLKSKIWGGNKLQKVLNKNIIDDNAGESWEISGVEGDISVVADGYLKDNNLQELIEVYMGDLIGDKVYESFGTSFPILIKFIDASQDLSIQVHPDDNLALKRHGTNGKTEMWYIIQADEGAEMPVGFSKKISRVEYIEHLQSKSLINVLNIEKVNKGDVFYLPAGRVHAIGSGILLAEIQQTSDITYRIYDYDRPDKNGKLRELHTDLALDAIDFNVYDEYKVNYSNKVNETASLVQSNYFTTNILDFDHKIEKEYIHLDSFVIYICTEGEFSITYHDKEKILMKKGETVLIPAVLKKITLDPEKYCRILEVFIT